MVDIEKRILLFEQKFSEDDNVENIEVSYIEQDQFYYYADMVLTYTNGDIDVFYYCKYPKKLIDMYIFSIEE
jgi:hypothetical protein